MKSTLAVAAAFFASQASAHYIFQTVNGGAPYVYIRTNTNMNSPVTDMSSTDMRCNTGADTGGSTSTLSIAAGGSVTIGLDTPVYHIGPISFYMSKVPSGETASSYDGSSSWFKIKDIGPDFSSGQADWTATQQAKFTVSVPSCIAPGDYLLRPQSLAIHNPYPAALPQVYGECLQLTVTGGGSTIPSPTTLIPGAVKNTDPGYTVNVYNNFHNYTIPGPAVFSCSGGSQGGSPPPSSTATKQTTTMITTTSKPGVTTTKPITTTTTAASTGACAAKYAQCGGQGWTGATCCASGSTCTASGQYYSQCL